MSRARPETENVKIQDEWAGNTGRTKHPHAPGGGEAKVKTAAANPTKLLAIIAMLRRPDGATIADLAEA